MQASREKEPFLVSYDHIIFITTSFWEQDKQALPHTNATRNFLMTFRDSFNASLKG